MGTYNCWNGLFPNKSTLQTGYWQGSDVNVLTIVNPLWGSGVGLVPNCTFSLCFGTISGDLSPAMAHILVRQNEPDIYSSEVLQEVAMGIYCTQIQPSDHDFVAVSSQGLDITSF